MISTKNAWNSVPAKNDIDHVRFKSEQTLFCYTKGKRYIHLTQQKNDQELYYAEIHNIGIKHPVINSLILDDGLSIIQSTKSIKQDFQTKLKQQSHQNQPQVQLSFLKKRFEIPQMILEPIPYIRYPELNDFQIGRIGFGRTIQSYKIKSDSISRDHCEIVRIKSYTQNIINKHKIIQSFLTTKSYYSSNLRKLPCDVWQIIFDYAQPQEKYLIRDFGSRNGTYIHEVGCKAVQLFPNYDYQIDGQSYGIHIKQIFTSADTPNQSILQHNAKVGKMITEFTKEVSWCYYESAKKSLLIPDKDIKNNTTGKFSFLVFKLKTKDPHEYYFIGINENYQKRFSIGVHQEIDIYPQEFQNASLHAMLVFKEGKWLIESMPYDFYGARQSYRKIWVSPAKNSCYYFNTSKDYKIKLGCVSKFSLEFKNF